MNDELSLRERADMRDLVLAGTQRIRPAGAHRTQIIAGAVALILVGGITGGAVTTAALFGDRQTGPISTPTETAPTPSPTPVTPTPTPTTPPAAEPAVAFGGDCGNTLTDDEVDALRGVGMMRSDYRWRTGANDVLGGIDCVWVSEEAYLIATVHLYAYPESVVPDAVRDAIVAGCVDSDNGPAVECSAVGIVDGTWLHVRAYGPTEQVSGSGVDALYASAAARLADHPRAVPATPTARWWTEPDCLDLVSQIDPSTYGFERVALLEPSQTGPGPVGPESITSLVGAAFACEFHFTSGTGDNTSGEVVRIDVVPGGAVTFSTAVEAERSQVVTVDGAEAAVIAPGLDRYEGSGDVVVATDGVNVLMVTPDFVRATADAVPLASTLFALMHP